MKQRLVSSSYSGARAPSRWRGSVGAPRRRRTGRGTGRGQTARPAGTFVPTPRATAGRGSSWPRSRDGRSAARRGVDHRRRLERGELPPLELSRADAHGRPRPTRATTGLTLASAQGLRCRGVERPGLPVPATRTALVTGVGAADRSATIRATRQASVCDELGHALSSATAARTGSGTPDFMRIYERPSSRRRSPSARSLGQALRARLRAGRLSTTTGSRSAAPTTPRTPDRAETRTRAGPLRRSRSRRCVRPVLVPRLRRQPAGGHRDRLAGAPRRALRRARRPPASKPA